MNATNKPTLSPKPMERKPRVEKDTFTRLIGFFGRLKFGEDEDQGPNPVPSLAKQKTRELNNLSKFNHLTQM